MALFLVAVVAYAIRASLLAASRRSHAYLLLGLALLAAIASRIFMLAYLETTMFPAFGNWPHTSRRSIR